MTQTNTPRTNIQESHLNRARASLRQALSWYTHLRKPGQRSSNSQLAGLVKPELDALTSTLSKLESNVIRIAAFGLVSRGPDIHLVVPNVDVDGAGAVDALAGGLYQVANRIRVLKTYGRGVDFVRFILRAFEKGAFPRLRFLVLKI